MKRIPSVRQLVAERRTEDGLMALIHEHASRLLSRLPRTHVGVVVTGSHRPDDGTHEAIIGPTAAIIGDDGDSMVNPTRIPVGVGVFGDQYGTVGDERVVLIPAPTRSGFVALMHYGEDDSPGAPAGEIWRVHRKADGTIDHFSKWTNDGPTAGDGLGGQVHSGFALHEVTTAGGLSTTHDDTTKQIKKTANAQTYTIWDAQGNAISHVAPSIGLGDLASNLDATHAAFRQSDISSYDQNLQDAKLQDYIKYTNLLVTAGTVTAAQQATILAALVAGWTNSTTVPDGSSVVKIK